MRLRQINYALLVATWSLALLPASLLSVGIAFMTGWMFYDLSLNWSSTMLKIKPLGSTFNWTVKVLVPGDLRHAEHSFTANFKAIDRERLIQLTPGDVEEDQALLEEVFVGFDGVQDEDGNPLSFSPETRRMLLNIPYVRTAITNAFFAAIAGRKAKN